MPLKSCLLLSESGFCPAFNKPLRTRKQKRALSHSSLLSNQPISHPLAPVNQMRIFKSITTRDATEQDILSLELKVGATLPADYRQFLLDYNGGVPEPACFDFTTS